MPDLEFCPTAYTGEQPWKGYPETFVPAFENNADCVLQVCICDGCEDAKPRLEELAKSYRLSIFYKTGEGVRPISELFDQKSKAL